MPTDATTVTTVAVARRLLAEVLQVGHGAVACLLAVMGDDLPSRRLSSRSVDSSSWARQ